jgi:tetratricopeptide (TPR) repeat protein
LPDSELRWWVGLNLGRLAASAGEYQLALNRFREVCAAAAAKPLSREFHCAALLNLGLLHKDLLQFEDASQCCRQALSLRQQDLGPNHADLLPYYHALGGIHIARRDADALSEIAETIERLSGGLPKQHANALTSRHQLAMMHYLRDEFESRDSERRHAREIWTDVLDTARSAGQPMVAARTLHYLARLDYLDVLADLRNWKTSLAQLRGTDSRQLQQLRELTVDFERRSSELQVQRQRYLEDLEKYDRRADSDHEARVRAHQALVETHGKLDQERSTLGKLRNEIEQAQSRLEESRNRLAAQTSLPGGDHAGRWHDRLKQGLSRASEAVATLRDLDRYPSLHYVPCVITRTS